MVELKTNKLKILITGANGQLGRCLQDVAIKFPNYDFDFKSSNEIDITKKNQIEDLFSQEQYNYCINCAAYTAVDKAETDQENAFLVNAEAVSYIARACKAYNTTLIHISTDFVFNGFKTSPYTEEDIPEPLNVYGSSKLKGEQYVREILESYYIIRTSWVYSEYGHNFVKTMLRLGSEKDEISVVNDQMGSPTFAEDLAIVIMNIINSETNFYGVYHFSNEGDTSWCDFATAIFALKGFKVKVNPIPSEAFPTAAKRPKSSVLDKSKTINNLNITIPFWEDSLKKCLQRIN
jgi:dTDP-4-dehydrorhamnose reductase